MKIDFNKANGLVPAIVQDASTKKVLMLGYMNEEAYNKTLETGDVYFYSRSKEKLWMKGETSGNVLKLSKILVDCDQDSLLVLVNPTGPVCHEGNDTCFQEKNTEYYGFLTTLEALIDSRKISPSETSYTSSLFQKGPNRIIQKFGEEAVELMIEAKDSNEERFPEECADMLYHFLVLLREKETDIAEVVKILKKRSKGDSKICEVA